MNKEILQELTSNNLVTRNKYRTLTENRIAIYSIKG